MNRYLEKTIQSFDQSEIWYRCIGEGKPTLVLCDGVGCGGFIWKYLIPYFDKKHCLLHWNYRGHGKSPAPEKLENIGVEESAEDLKEILEDAGQKQPVVLLGHSMGVQVIFEFYHRFPERVRALIPVTGSYGRALDHIHDSVWPRRLFPLAKYLTNEMSPVVKAVWRWILTSELAVIYSMLFEINPKLNKREDFIPYLEHLSQMDPQVFVRMLEGAARHTAEPYLQEIKVPTLIVAGEIDRFTPYWISQRMHALIAGSELLTLPLASHTGPIEQPELTNLRIASFIEQL